MTLSSTYKSAVENSRHSANNFRDAFDEIITWYFASEGAVFLLQAGLDRGGCLLLPFTLIGWLPANARPMPDSEGDVESKQKKRCVLNFNVVVLLLLCVSVKIQAQSLSIDEAIDLWRLDSATFDSLQSCPMVANPLPKSLILSVNLKFCMLTEVAAYTLIKECQAGTTSSILIRNTEDESKLMLFTINRRTCALLSPVLPQNAASAPASPSREAQQHTFYVLQFYSGQTAPKAGIETCGIALPLHVHHINNTYYLFSEAIERFSDASRIMNELQMRCPELEVWVRPIER